MPRVYNISTYVIVHSKLGCTPNDFVLSLSQYSCINTAASRLNPQIFPLRGYRKGAIRTTPLGIPNPSLDTPPRRSERPVPAPSLRLTACVHVHMHLLRSHAIFFRLRYATPSLAHTRASVELSAAHSSTETHTQAGKNRKARASTQFAPSRGQCSAGVGAHACEASASQCAVSRE